MSFTPTLHSIADMLPNDQLASGLFFIVGSGRSGTTLLQAMLASHPRLGIPPETKFFQRHDPIEERFGGDPLPQERLDDYLNNFFESRDWADLGLPRDDVEEAMRAGDRSARSLFLAIIGAYQNQCGKARIGEKSPLHCRCVPRIREVLPDAKFIHIHRDPRDVVASMLGMEWTAGSVRGLARSWFKTMREHLVCLREVPDSQYTGVRFETLVAEPEAELRRLCDFLGEMYDPAMLNFHDRNDAGYAEREAEWKSQTSRPLSSQSIGRFKRDLTPRQIALVERTVGPMLERFGYEACAGWRRGNPVWTALDSLDYVKSKLLASGHHRGDAQRGDHQSDSAA